VEYFFGATTTTTTTTTTILMINFDETQFISLLLATNVAFILKTT
jgi:hypothetical protein